MLIRYGTEENGKLYKKAKIFTISEHGISANIIDSDAAAVTKRLAGAGFEAYIVGGAIRDILLNIKPKDFDIATNASPKQIRKLFWNSRIIGRRFRLVHIHFAEKIIEVSTFRSLEEKNNSYGTIEEDAKRRDFSVNALYYCPINEYIIDYVDAYKDIKKKRIKSLLPLDTTFVDDPVRMIRAVKYEAITGFHMTFTLKRSIKKYSIELKRCPSSRMTEEVFKILQSGYAAQIIGALIKYNLFQFVLPTINALVINGEIKQDTKDFFESLQELDKLACNKEEIKKGKMLSELVSAFCFIPEEYENQTLLFQAVFKDIKRLIEPITPPNQEVEMAVSHLFRKEGIPVPKLLTRKRRAPVHKQKQPAHKRRKIRKN